jgi:peptidoglycan-associated lipoprotein
VSHEVRVVEEDEMRPVKQLRSALLLLVMLAFVAGCSSTKDTEDSIYTEEGMSETDMGAGKGSSLDQFRRGTLGTEQGPLDDIFFAYDSADVSGDARGTLDRNAEWLRANPTARVEIEGHCDSRGTVEYNLGLGARRASAARDYLVSLGISPERMTTISYGKEIQVCQEETTSCWERNRRAHFVVLS